jgi:hypothetical protein
LDLGRKWILRNGFRKENAEDTEKTLRFGRNPETRWIRTDGGNSINPTGPERKQFPDVKVRAIEKPPSVHLLKGITPMGGNPEGKRFSEGRFPIQDEIPRKRCLLSEETSTSGVSLNRKQFQESEILNWTILLDGDPLEGVSTLTSRRDPLEAIPVLTEGFS